MAFGMRGDIAGAARAVSAEVIRVDIAVTLGPCRRNRRCNAPGIFPDRNPIIIFSHFFRNTIYIQFNSLLGSLTSKLRVQVK